MLPACSDYTLIISPVINASFVEAFYTLLEGGNNQIMPLVNTSASSTDPIMLDILQGMLQLLCKGNNRGRYMVAILAISTDSEESCAPR